MSGGDGSDFVPRWGQLPVEQYLIENQRHWDYSSSESINDQRKRLVREYMQLEEIPKEWDTTRFTEYSEQQPERIPTAEEVATILCPWRSDDMRKKAWHLWAGENFLAPVMLRTYYENSSAGDQKIAEYADTSDNYAESADWAVLDDAELFNYGSDWKQILSVLPEIIGFSTVYQRAPLQAKLDRDLPKLKGAFTRAKREHPGWKQDVNLLLNGNGYARDLLCAVSMGWLWIVDEEAFKTDKLLVVYLDLKQNITVQGRMDVDQGDMDEIQLKWYDRVPPGPIFDEGTVGDTYRLDTESGREFFRLTV
ncbi:hypothetical protein ASPSYDRAFT_35128 [Aspergillus sydowii CBS 593.65]|uniref:Uncharacterized protein n=1 Tax=Aspergillus sydowii CBS 593.65 TaxID=1036612 RepID=A0A1L9T4X8_9EURO|nr:uncharacterized protein ASPSYDRAFT_35128 [Aspergillus sydowii CBS 593.65]OJJ54421.1 hypothetical protein ASPSYDRAFT_35128 [Aspergillus sydowii CBS 593.65]